MKRRTLSLRYRVMALTLLPMTLLALVLGSYFTLTRVADNRANLLERGSSLARLLASASEFGVLSGNSDLLHSLSAGPIRDDEVADILFYDQDFRLLYRSAGFEARVDQRQTLPQLHRGVWYFVEPIRVSTEPLIDNPELVPLIEHSETLGWVAVLISAQPSAQREREILLRGVALTLGGLVLAAFLASRFGRRITRPILGLTRLIERLQAGELNARADVIYTGELRTLASGINRLAARLQESNQQFEFRVESATRRLTSTLRHLEQRNQELQLERQRADDANRAKDEFLARMSHELRTPLTSVIGFARLLSQTRLDTEQQEYVQIVNRTSELLLTIIDDILDFSRLQSDAITLESIPFELESCLFDVLDAQSSVAFAKEVELVADLDPELPTQLLGDPSRLSQVLTNLLGNAVKFTEQGQVSLSAWPEQLPEGEQLCIRIEDTGIGIAADRIGQLFSAFTQGDNSISRRFGGSGLGLVIAHRLVLLMGGQIDLHSEEGRGTRVSLRLPLRIPEPSQQAPVQVPAKTSNPPLPRQSTDELWLLEANPQARAALQHQLAAEQRQIRLLEEQPQLLQQLEHSDCVPTLVISLSPAQSERQAVSALCGQIRARSAAPILLLVPDRSPLPLTFDGVQVLHKPVRPSRLRRALKQRAPELEPTAHQPVPAPQLTCPLQVLLAEDNDFNRLLIRRLLEGFGAQVSAVSSGGEALEALHRQTPDLVLMDVHMPGLDGIEATRRAREHWPTLPIVAITANVVPHEHQALISAGITDLLLKPVDVAALLRLLQGFCNLKTGTANAVELAPPATDTLHQLAPADSVLTEVRRLTEQAEVAVRALDRAALSSFTHQLIGIAGLYDKPVLEECTSALQAATQEGSARALWYALRRLQRIVAQPELE